MGIVKLVIAAIAVGFAVAVALAQNSTPELDNPATQVAPNPKPPEPDGPAAQVAPKLEGLSKPIFESLSPEPDNPAMQTLKALAPEIENPPTRAIPNPSAPITPKTR